MGRIAKQKTNDISEYFYKTYVFYWEFPLGVERDAKPLMQRH